MLQLSEEEKVRIEKEAMKWESMQLVKSDIAYAKVYAYVIECSNERLKAKY